MDRSAASPTGVPLDHRPPLVAVALLSGSVLAYEVVLIRLFSLVQWHHFAHMVISLALLGYGVSGVVLAQAGRRLGAHPRRAFAAGAVLFGLAAPGGFLVAQALPFNPLELLWRPSQSLWLTAVYLVLAVPFLFAAGAIGLLLMHYRRMVPRVYAADLAGAGLGSLAVAGLLLTLFPQQVLLLTAAASVLAGAAALSPGRRRTAAVLVTLAAAGLAWVSGGARLLAPVPSPYKALSQTLEVAGAHVLEERAGPLSVLTVVDSPKVPFRHAPGLSMVSPHLPPEQLAVFSDGEGMTAINRWTGPADSAYLDQTTSAAAYHLLDRPRVLVLGAAGGSDVLQALDSGARAVDAVEVDPEMVTLMSGPYRTYSGDLFTRPEVAVHRAEARTFAARSGRSYDLIQVSLLDSAGAGAAGLNALAEGYLYTVEGISAYLARLAPGGYLAITRWVRTPPRGSLKLFATAVAALRGAGVADAGARLAWVRGWNTITLLVKQGDLRAEDVDRLKRFARQRAFDLDYFPGSTEADGNRYVRLDQPVFHRAATALLGPDADDFIARYKFDIRPATDDRPYFFNSFRWRALPELVRLRGLGGEALLDAGYLVLVLTLVQAAVASLVLVALPAWWRLRRRGGEPRASRWGVLLYFLAIGLAFLFVELAFIQRFVLFLGDPVYATALVLAGFLVFAGLGSLSADRWPGSPATRVWLAVALVAGLGLGYGAALPALTPWLLARPDTLRVVAALAFTAPLAFAMGVPFPTALSRLGASAAELVPWAWAVNGCASVFGVVLAAMLAVQWGLAALMAAAAGLYLLAAGVGGATFLRRE